MQGVNGSIESHTLEAISIRVMGQSTCQLLISKYSENYMHTCMQNTNKLPPNNISYFHKAHTLEAISIRVMGQSTCQLLISKYSENYMHTCMQNANKLPPNNSPPKILHTVRMCGFGIGGRWQT